MSKKSVDVTGSKAQPKAKKPYIQKDTIGSTQTAEIVYGLGDGENGGLINGLNSIILDGTRVVGDSGEVNFNEVKFEERKGTIDQEPLKIIEDTSVERGLNVEFRSASPAVSTFNNPDVDKYVVRISIPQLMQNKDNGDSVAATIAYAIDIAVDGGAFEEVVNASATEKITNGFEIDHEIEAPAGNVRTIRVRRITPDSTSQLLVNKTYLAAISEVINAKFSYPTIHHVGLIFNAEQFNSVPKAVFHYYGRLIKVPTNYDPVTRKYTGIWNGTFKVVYSNNPAWVLYDILTDRRSGLGRRIDPSMIDKWELYQIGVYCDELVPDGLGGVEPRFVCNNLILNARQDAYQVIRDIASIFRGQAFWNGSAVVTRADAPRDIDYAISMSSVVSYSYSGTSSNARHNVVKVQYYDKNNENKAAYEFATDYNSIRETGRINEIEIRAFGCTSAGQAQRLARYTLLSEQTETRLLVAKVALDAFVNMQIGDIFAWSDRNLAGSENGGRIVAVDGNVLTLDRDVTTSAAIGDDIFVNTGEGKASSRTITAVNKNKVTVDAVIERAEPENVWVIDAEELSLLYFKLEDYKINPSDNTVDIRGVQHVRSKFAAIDTETAIEAPPFSKVEIETLRAPANVTTNFNVRVDQGMNVADVYVAWGQVKGATRYTVEFRRDSQAWRTLGVTTGVTHTIDNVTAGIYEVRIRAMDGIGNMSPYGYSAPLNVNGAVMLPPKLTSFSAVGKMFAIEANWTFPAGTEAALATVIEYSNVDPATVGAETQQLNITYPQTSFTFNALSAQATLWMRAAIMDKYNQIGEFTKWTSAAVDTDPQSVLDLVEGHINEGSLSKALQQSIKDGELAKGIAEAADASARASKQAADTAAGLASAARDKADTAASAIEAEKKAREADILAANNGITQEILERKEGDAANLAVINNYKSSNDAALANVRTEVQAATAANSTQAGQITAIDGRLSAAEGNLATKAEVSAVNALDTKIANVDGKVTLATESLTALNGRIATVEGAVATKADANALNNIYTKTESDAKSKQIAAGEINKYDANLVIGGVNLIPNSFDIGQWSNHGTAWPLEADVINGVRRIRRIGGTEPTIMSNYTSEFVDLPVGTTYTISVKVRPIGSDYLLGFYGSDNSIKLCKADQWTTIRDTRTAFSQPERVAGLVSSAAQDGVWVEVKEWQAEIGNKATSWSPSPADVQGAINTNANAIQTVNAEVSRVNGQVVATVNSVNELTSNVGLLQGSINEVRQTVTNNQESTNTLVTSLRSGMADADDISMMMRNATVLYEDFNFKQGDSGNGIKVYNNYDNGALLWQFTDKLPDNPVASTRQLQFTHNGGYTTPELGGFYQLAQSRPNAVFVVKFVAKLPVGFNFNLAANSIGYGASSNFIGGSEGTGKFKTYYGVFRCGYTGVFSTLGFVYVSGAQPSPDNPLVWYLASSTVYDCFDSKVAPDSVINGIAEAKSTASTAVNKAEATAMIAQNLQAALDVTNATITTNYYTKADMSGVIAQQVSTIESQRIIGGTNLWSLSVANMVSEQGAHSLEVKRPEEDEYWVTVTATSSGVTLVRFDNCLVDTNTPPVEGEDYVISFELSSNWYNRLSTIYMYVGGYATRIESTDVMLDPAKWTRFSFTLKANGTAVGGASQMIGFLLEESKGWSPNSVLSIRHLQCQRGTVSTQFEKSTVKLGTRIKETSESVNGIMGIKTVTIDNNGVLSGYGLISELKNGQVTSSFGVNANSFFIGAPSNNKKPFIVLTDSGQINGVTVPAGTYIDTAMIANATIKLAHINTASIGSLSAISATLGTLVAYKDAAYPNKARMVITGSLITVYDDNNKVRVKLGMW